MLERLKFRHVLDDADPAAIEALVAATGVFSAEEIRTAAALAETTLDGNSVVLEEEMMKMSDTRMNYDAAVSFYQKSLDLLRTAAKKPG